MGRSGPVAWRTSRGIAMPSFLLNLPALADLVLRVLRLVIGPMFLSISLAALVRPVSPRPRGRASTSWNVLYTPEAILAAPLTAC